MLQEKKYLDLSGLIHLWENIQTYIDKQDASLNKDLSTLSGSLTQQGEQLATIQSSYIKSIEGKNGDISLDNASTTPGSISFSIDADNVIKGSVVGLSDSSYDNFIECTEDQIKGIIGDIIPGPSNSGGSQATTEDIGGLFPTE